MSEWIGSELPKAVAEAFDGSDLERKIGTGHLLVTLDQDGTARPCMLSAGEVLAIDKNEMRLGVWRGTHTAANLASDRALIFCFVTAGNVLYIRGKSKALTPVESGSLAIFTLTVDSIESDFHAGMPVINGISFTVSAQRRQDVVVSWSQQLAELRMAGE
jgi:hypothetical protein